MSSLSGKVAIITGGAASIGAAITRKLHADGAKVVVAARSQDKGEAIAAELGDGCSFISTDITKDEDLRALVNATRETYGGLHIVVNNACSYGDDGASTDRETWLNTINTNAVSAAILGEIARPLLKGCGGCIVNIGSVSGRFSAHRPLGLPGCQSDTSTPVENTGGRVRAGTAFGSTC